jgi:multidrug transporter EmrE-like cation transporter
MMPNHFQALVLFAATVSTAFALLSKHTLGEQIRYAVWAFLGFVVVAIGIGWLMYPFSR